MKASAYIKKKNGVATARICRWCLARGGALKSLANDESGQYKLQTIFDCTGFQANSLPGVPTFLCAKCESRLEKMYKFRWRCNKNIALVNGFTKKQDTAKNEAGISKDHLGHSAEHTVGTEMSIKTEVTTADAARDLHLIQKSCTAHPVGTHGIHECCGNQADDLFEAEENPIAIKLENEGVDEQDNSQTNPSELICQDREDPPATTNTFIKDSTSESIRNGIAAIETRKHLKLSRKRGNDQEKILHRLRSYKRRSDQRVNPTELICQDREDPPATTNTCVNDSASESIQIGIAAIDAGKNLNVGRKRKNDEEKRLQRLRSYKRRNDQRVNNHINRNAHRKGHRNKQKHHCSVTYVRSSKLKIHIRTHTDEIPNTCKICDRSFRSSKLLQKHSVRHNKDHKCPHCPSKFALSSELKVHIRVHTIEKPYVCKICDQAFSSSSSLAEHKKIHNKDKYHQCPHCPSKFAQLSTFKNHLRIHTGEKPFVCKVCDQAFRFSSNLAEHKKIHNKDQQHQCPHCPSKFPRLNAFKNHVRIHTGEKPFVCRICQKAFHSSSVLSLHSKIHNKDQHHQCPHCPFKFVRLSHLNDHIRTHTGEKPFVCKVCDQAFRSSSNLAEHKKTHNKDQHRQCPHCPFKFVRLSHLNDHIRTHTGERPFVCKICQKAFHSSSALSLHSKTHKKNQ